MKLIKKILHNRMISALLLALLTLMIVTLVRQSGFWQGIELSAYDSHLKFNAINKTNDSPIVLVKITEADIQRFGHPISDETLYQALSRLLALDVAVIGVDIYRDMQTKGRDQLAVLAQKNDIVVFVEKALGNPIAAPAFLRDTSQTGFADLKQDQNGVIRRGLLMLWDTDNTPKFSFSLQLALKFLEPRKIVLTADPNNPQQIKLGETIVTKFSNGDAAYVQADDGGYQYLLTYPAGTDDYQTHTLSDVIDGKVAGSAMSNALVIIGVAADSVRDLHETPFSSNWAGRERADGVDIHAQMTDQLLRGVESTQAPVSVVPKNIELIGLFLLCLLGTLCTLFYEKRISRLIALLLSSALILFAVSQYAFSAGLWVPIVPPIFGVLMSASLMLAYLAQRERKSVDLMMKMFGKFVSPEVAAMLWQQRDEIIENGKPKTRRMISTVMITDLQSFVASTQQMSASELMTWLNTYLNEMTKIATKHGGFVDDYAGDGIKINFGVPIKRTSEAELNQDAINAVACALEMTEKVVQLNKHAEVMQKPVYKLRVGINTGEIVAGCLGNAKRMKYTTVGEVVNIAARLESFQKDLFVASKTGAISRILMSADTKDRLNGMVKTEFLGEKTIPGKPEKLPIYCVTPKTDLYYHSHGGSHAKHS